jgi:hypothetical protein
MGLLNENLCSKFRAQLEEVPSTTPSAKSLTELLEPFSPAARQHAQSCAACHQAAEDLLATRAALSLIPSSANLGGAWFASRVMAAIAERKAELARAADTWTFLPKLAARLTWASSIALLLASAWLYQRPVTTQQAAPRVVATDITGEPIVDSSNPPNNDDVLVSLAEKPKQ